MHFGTYYKNVTQKFKTLKKTQIHKIMVTLFGVTKKHGEKTQFMA